jgi:hypothetical protein
MVATRRFFFFENSRGGHFDVLARWKLSKKGTRGSKTKIFLAKSLNLLLSESNGDAPYV